MNLKRSDIQISHRMNRLYGNPYQEIVLAGGCFWGTEAYLKKLPGILDTEVVYVNGKNLDPTYEEVCSGQTGHAEAVYLVYDPQVIGLDYLLTYFFKTIDPKAVNRQGNDFGSQYRSGIYWMNEEDLPTIENVAQRIVYEVNGPIATEIRPLESMSPAEEYHQDYLDKNPGGYCHVSFDTLPKEGDTLVSRSEVYKENPLYRYQNKSDRELRSSLSELSYNVTQKGHTERPKSSPLDKEDQAGIYVDITNGQPLFSSLDKYDAGCGWPSFTRPIDLDLIMEVPDKSYGMRRTEVKSDLSKAHLGHVFTDGPQDRGGLRYCINGAALRFVSLPEMKQEGYGYLLTLFESVE